MDASQGWHCFRSHVGTEVTIVLHRGAGEGRLDATVRLSRAAFSELHVQAEKQAKRVGEAFARALNEVGPLLGRPLTMGSAAD